MALPSGVLSVPLPGTCPALVSRSRAAPTPASQTPGDGRAYLVKRETSAERVGMILSPRCRPAPASMQISAPWEASVSRQTSAPRAIGPNRELSPRPGYERNAPSVSSSAAPGQPRELSPQPRILHAPFPSSAVCTPGRPRDLSPQQQRIDRHVPVMPCLSGGAVLDERKRRELSSSRFPVGSGPFPVGSGMLTTTSADVSLPSTANRAFSSRFAVEAGTPATIGVDARLNVTTVLQPVLQPGQLRKPPAGPQRSRSTERAGGTRMAPQSSVQQSTTPHRSQMPSTPFQQNVVGTNVFRQASALSSTLAPPGFPMQSMVPQLASARNTDYSQQPRELLAHNSASMTLPVGVSPIVASPGLPMQSAVPQAMARNPSPLRQQMEARNPSPLRQQMELATGSSATLPVASPVQTIYGAPGGENQAGHRNLGIGPPRDPTLAPGNVTELKSNSQLCSPPDMPSHTEEEMIPFYHERFNGAQETRSSPAVATLREELTQAQEMMSALREELLQPFRALDDLVRAQDLMQTKLDVLDEEVHQVLHLPPTDQMIKEEHAAGSSYHPSPVPIESGMESTCDTTPDLRHATHAENTSGRGDLDAGQGEYCIILDKANGAKLGINLKDDETKEVLVVNDVKPGGLVHLWNTEHPEAQVIIGHFIVEVNGVEGSSELMLEECQSNKVLHITLKRPHFNATIAHERVQLHASEARTSFVIAQSQPVGQYVESELPSFEMMTQNVSEEVESPADIEARTSKQLRFDNDAVNGYSESESNNSEVWDSDARLSVACKKTLAVVAGETILQIATSTLRKSCAARQFSMFSAALAGVADPAFSTQACEEVDRNKLSEDKDCLEVVRQLFFDSLPEEFVKVDKIEQVFKPLLLRDFVKGVSKRGGRVEALFHGVLSLDAEYIKSDGVLPLQDSAQGVHVATHAGVAHQNTEQDIDGRRRMCLVLADTSSPLKKMSDVDQEDELRLGAQTRHSFVEDGRLLASHLITYTVTGVVKKRTNTGWHDPFEKKLSEAIKKSVSN